VALSELIAAQPASILLQWQSYRIRQAEICAKKYYWLLVCLWISLAGMFATAILLVVMAYALPQGALPK